MPLVTSIYINLVCNRIIFFIYINRPEYHGNLFVRRLSWKFLGAGPICLSHKHRICRGIHSLNKPSRSRQQDWYNHTMIIYDLTVDEDDVRTVYVETPTVTKRDVSPFQSASSLYGIFYNESPASFFCSPFDFFPDLPVLDAVLLGNCSRCAVALTEDNVFDCVFNSFDFGHEHSDGGMCIECAVTGPNDAAQICSACRTHCAATAFRFEVPGEAPITGVAAVPLKCRPIDRKRSVCMVEFLPEAQTLSPVMSVSSLSRAAGVDWLTVCEAVSEHSELAFKTWLRGALVPLGATTIRTDPSVLGA